MALLSAVDVDYFFFRGEMKEWAENSNNRDDRIYYVIISIVINKLVAQFYLFSI